MSNLLNRLKSALPTDAATDAQIAEFERHSSSDPDSLIADLAEDAGPNPTHFDADTRYEDSDDDEEDETRRQKAKRILKVVAHPVRLIKDHSNKKTAAKVAVARPVVPKANDRESLKAQQRVESRDVRGEVSTGENHDPMERNAGEEGEVEGEEAQEDDLESLHGLMGERDSLRVAWTMGEGVMRVVAVDRRKRALPTVKEFQKLDDDGNEEIQWKDFTGTTSQYIDQFGQVPFQTDLLRRHVHRLLVSSAPLQKWIVNLRAVYRWDGPYQTLGWVVLYAFLVGINRVATFFLGWFIWHIVRNGMYHSRPTESKNAIERKLDSSKSSATVAELIDHCNQDDWLFPLLDIVGPIMQLQLNDAADLLEILDNLLAGGIIAFNLFSAASMLRCTWVLLGFLFFGLWPVSGLYPRYHLLVSPARWTLCGVPTHALWGISQLQLHAARVKKGLRQRAEQGWHDGHNLSIPRSKGLPQVDLASFSFIFHSESRHSGKLVISTAGVRFQGVGKASSPEKAAFDILYPRLVEICKTQTRAKKAMPVNAATRLLNAMEITYEMSDGKAVGASKVVLEHCKGRDRAFNLILAFSGVEWKTLQPYTDD